VRPPFMGRGWQRQGRWGLGDGSAQHSSASAKLRRLHLTLPPKAGLLVLVSHKDRSHTASRAIGPTSNFLPVLPNTRPHPPYRIWLHTKAEVQSPPSSYLSLLLCAFRACNRPAGHRKRLFHESAGRPDSRYAKKVRCWPQCPGAAGRYPPNASSCIWGSSGPQVLVPGGGTRAAGSCGAVAIQRLFAEFCTGFPLSRSRAARYSSASWIWS